MKYFNILISLFFYLFCFSAYAGKVMKVKGEKVYILFDKDEPFTSGDYFILNNDAGKKLGLIQIKKSKGTKAIGLLKKGKAEKGFTTTFKSPGKKTKKQSVVVDESSANDEGDTSSSSAPTSRLGLLLGYGMASQKVNQGPLGVSSQSGRSIALRGLYDYSLSSSLYFRAMGGLEMLSVSGSGAPISNSSIRTSIGTDITYLAIDGLFQWSFWQSRASNFYLIGGMGFLYPLSKSSDAILVDSIDSLAIGEVGIGYEMKLKGYTLPVDLMYYYFPAGADVTTSVISVKLGILF